MQFLKLTKNISGKTIRVNPNYVVDIEEGDLKEDPDAKAPANEKDKKQQKKTVTIVTMAKGKTLFVTETPEEIDNQVVKIKAIRIEI